MFELSKLNPADAASFNANHFETAVIVRNPDNKVAVKEAEFAKSRLSKLMSEVVIEESQPGGGDYQDLLQRYDDPANKTVWITVGGDGTFSNFANAKPQSPIIINPAGNANDIGHMLAGIATYGHPERILKWGRVARLRPLEIIAQPPGDSPAFIELAFGYWGAGLSGHVAETLSQHEHRSNRDKKLPIGRLIVDGKAIDGSRQTMPGLKIIEDDRQQLLYELMYANGDRFAKIFRVSSGQLLEPKAHRVELNKRDRLSLVATMGKTMLIGGNDHLAASESHEFKIETTDSSFWSQRDGENRKQLSGTTFHISVSDYSAKVLASRRSDIFKQILL